MFKTVFSMPLFNFDTPGQIREKDELVNSRMFPFGEAQQEWEKGILKELFPEAKKIELQMLRFEVLTRREAYVKASLQSSDADYQDLPGSIQKWEEEIRQTPLHEEQIRIIIAMAELENEATDMDSMPTAARILERSKQAACIQTDG